MPGDHFKDRQRMAQFSPGEGDRITLERRAGRMKGYFRFSRYLERAESLAGWSEWFNSRGIPWFLERRSDPSHIKNCFLFALWRKGKEAVAFGTKRLKETGPLEIIQTGLINKRWAQNARRN